MLSKLSKTIVDQLIKLTTIRRRDGRWFIYYKVNRFWDAKLKTLVKKDSEDMVGILGAWNNEIGSRFILLDFHCVRSSRSLFRLLFDFSKNTKSLCPKDEPRLWIEKSLSNFYLPGCDFMEYVKNLKSDLNYLMSFESDDVNYNSNHSFIFKNMVAISFTDPKEAAMFKLQFC